MMLRDHFRPPLDNERHWESFHATWPVMIVANLNPKLPRGYTAEPRVHSGTSAEIDVATFENESEGRLATGDENVNGGGIATAVWAPTRPTLAVATDLPAQDVYEVLVYNAERHSRLVAVVEIVSPANKDRPAHRRAFAAKCAGLLRERVSVVIIDVVTTRTHNLYGALLDLVGQTDPSLSPEPPLLYAAACRMTKRGNQWFLETWMQSLGIGRSVPTVPLWLADDLALPLDLQASYEQSCSILNIR
jgi:hypothetical protein